MAERLIRPEADLIYASNCRAVVSTWTRRMPHRAGPAALLSNGSLNVRVRIRPFT